MTPGLVRPIPKVLVPGSAGAFLAVMTSQIGYREGSNNDNIFGVWYGMNHQAWCAIDVSWASRHSGCEKIIPKASFTEAMAQWFMDRNLWIDNDAPAKPGDIGFIWDKSMVSGSRPHGIHHVFAVQKEIDGGRVLTCEGNTNDNGSSQGNGVYALKRTRSRIRGFGRPKYVGVSVKLPVDLSNVIAKAKALGIYDGRVALGLTKRGFPATVAGYKKYQESLHYKGSDADGLAGASSLGKMGHEDGWEIKP